MTVRRTIAPGEYYHIFNRAAFKRSIFLDKGDWVRCLFYLIHFQSPTLFPHPERYTRSFSDQGFAISDEEFGNVMNGKQVELVSFCLMPNHVHFLLRELVGGGIGRYMQRVELAYTRYFNTRYEASGHVFQGRYKSVHVETNEQLMYLSAYIHRNPREVKGWKDREDRYPWSSLQDYVHENRWGGLLAQEIILDQFEGTKRSNYADFVKTSGAKLGSVPLLTHLSSRDNKSV